jgi:phosphopantothenoylcysteine decarboxylase/phosphopantothenate--cysteine ligase
VLVGFAAETHDLVTSATTKLETKRADLIVANDVSRADAGFEVETNAATLVDATGTTDLPLQPKEELARVILERVETLLSQRSAEAATYVDDPS